MGNIDQRLDTLEDHVLGQDASRPGVLLRLDRQERQLSIMLEVVKYLVMGGGLATIWKVAEFAISMKIGAPPP